MRILLIGGSGFIGHDLVNCIVENNHTVDILDPKKPTFSFNGVWYKSQIQDIDYRQLVDSYDWFIHLAATHKTPGHNPYEYMQHNISNAIATCHLLDATNTKRIVFVSSIAVYGSSDYSLDEDSLKMPNTPYGESKLYSEKILQIWQTKSPNRILHICRPGVVTGCGEDGNFTRFLNALLVMPFKFKSRHDTHKSWIYVRDLSNAILHMQRACETSIIYNAVHPTQILISQLQTYIPLFAPESRKPLTINLSLLLPFAKLLSKHSNTAMRVVKLFQESRVKPLVLAKYSFNWEYDLEKALVSWFGMSTRNKFE